jgi:hypothetical protein
MAHTSAPTLGKVKGWNQEAVHLTEVRYALQNSIESAIQPKKIYAQTFLSLRLYKSGCLQ